MHVKVSLECGHVFWETRSTRMKQPVSGELRSCGVMADYTGENSYVAVYKNAGHR